ncbi:MAG: Gfo/Idh/MocA family oxidoreductase [Spirochaetota bacterium]|nr:MAG: Gfo/Idh/MocA family oxidoreductase [Spirochaetota bacterium]
MQKKTFGVGIIGAGFMGKTHTYNYVNMPLFYDELPFKIKLVGICNRTLSKAEQLKDDFGYEFASGDYLSLLERKDIDIIDVCTPNIAHHEHITEALKAGKHVYADKPLCVTDKEADDIVKETVKADERGIVHQIAFHCRFYPAIKCMKRFVEDGLLGELVSFKAAYYHSSNLDPMKPRGWRVNIDESGGGVLYDMGSHALDLIYHFLGEYESVSMYSKILFPQRPDGKGNTIKVKTEDHVLVSASMKNRAVGTIEASKVIVSSNDDLLIELYGTLGAIRFNMMHPNYLWVYDSRDPENVRGFRRVDTVNKDTDSKGMFPSPRMGIGWLRGHIASQYNFMRCVWEKDKASPSFYDGAYIQKVMNRLYSVANTEQWVKV